MNDIDFVKSYAERFLGFINTKYKLHIKDVLEGKTVENFLSDNDLKSYPGMGEVEVFVYKFVRDNQHLFLSEKV